MVASGELSSDADWPMCSLSEIGRYLPKCTDLQAAVGREGGREGGRERGREGGREGGTLVKTF